ncbi:MAG: integration host factor subunit beta [Gammaproteobacteria bacterium]|jgi:integration host factor subunit beta|nr:integration host factor subunit beta [Gammaproteobacteria bacterium]MBT4608326.1 integration host factor subunit beta [Thiotrichales bacterium]MBT3718973.1 integration host factor subunit beta [Gammaproteobacteria bacterium]MBT3846222.1 integration host factor subunit beta [Gammaproteobacteria bacterium]MBT4301011.1 integration host factor subunit beta [Gammaproteobacteria bacterium]
MTKSELINRLYLNNKHNLPLEDVSAAVNQIIGRMTDALGGGGRVEVRGFGVLSLHERAARTGRNPRTGEAVQVPACYKVHFKPGKELKERVNSEGVGG